MSRRIADFPPVPFRRHDWPSYDMYPADLRSRTTGLSTDALALYLLLPAAAWEVGEGWLIRIPAASWLQYAPIPLEQARAALTELAERNLAAWDERDGTVRVGFQFLHRQLQYKKRGHRQGQRSTDLSAKSPSDNAVRGADNRAVRTHDNSPGNKADNGPDINPDYRSPPSTSPSPSPSPSSSPPETDAAPSEPCLGPTASADASSSAPTATKPSSHPKDTDAQHEPPTDLKPHDRWWRIDLVDPMHRAAQVKFVRAWPDLVSALKRAYPHLDADAQFAAAYAWEQSKPKKRKTPRGRAAFLRNWFAIEQDRGRSQDQEAGTAANRQQSPKPGEAREYFDPRNITLR